MVTKIKILVKEKNIKAVFTNVGQLEFDNGVIEGFINKIHFGTKVNQGTVPDIDQKNIGN